MTSPSRTIGLRADLGWYPATVAGDELDLVEELPVDALLPELPALAPARDVLRTDDLVDAQRSDLGPAVAADVQGALVAIRDPAIRRDEQDHVAGGLGQQPIAGLAGSQCPFRHHPIGHITGEAPHHRLRHTYGPEGVAELPEEPLAVARLELHQAPHHTFDGDEVQVVVESRADRRDEELAKAPPNDLVDPIAETADGDLVD